MPASPDLVPVAAHRLSLPGDLLAAAGSGELRETHTAWVALTADRAYKVKKPVSFGFVDFSTRERRLQACREEARVNEALAPGLVRDVAGLSRGPQGPVLAELGAGEPVVVMRRFDEARTMAALLARGRLAAGEARSVGRLLADFHAAAAPVPRADGAASVRRRMREDLAQLAAAGGDGALPGIVAELRRFTGAFLAHHELELDRRAVNGLIRDGHGDLRADHVVLEQPPIVVDRLEFDRELRATDVASDLAFLLMDLEARDGRWAADEVLAGYRDAGGDAGDGALLAFFAVQRAVVSAKVALLRARQAHGVGARALLTRARALLGLARRLAWRARGPLVLAVGGPPASGKSTLARKLARRSGWPLAGSDAIRKLRAGVAADEPAPAAAYSGEETLRVYATLGELARLRLAAGAPGVLVDATFGTRAARDAFRAGLAAAAPLQLLVCEAPPRVLARRAAARASEGGSASDAGAAVALRLARRFEVPGELPDVRRIDGCLTPDHQADLVTAWLDAGRARG